MTEATRRFIYPTTPQVDVIDAYHGTNVRDPYRWLEDDGSAATQEWVAEQNNRTRTFLDDIATREHIKARLTEIWDYPKYSVPYKRSGRYFFLKNDGLQNQAILYQQSDLQTEASIVLDPNILSVDGTAALTSQSISKDGTLLAYGISRHGSDWQELRVRNIDTGQEYDDVIYWCKFAQAAWKPDSSGFFYRRFPEPGTIPDGEQTFHSKIYWHTLGTPQSDDRLIYERPDAKELGFTPMVSEDGQYLILYLHRGTDPQNRIYYRPIDSDGPFIPLLDDSDARYLFIDNIGATFYFLTNLDAPRNRIIAIDINHPERSHWQEIIPEQDDPISFVTMANNRFVVAYLHDVHHQLMLYHPDGNLDCEIPLPSIGSITGLSGKRTDDELLFNFESFLAPPTTFRYDFATGTLSTFRTTPVNIDLAAYETKQVFYMSRDGTRVPMFITHKKGLELDGTNPVLLYGYGGFNNSLLPFFATSRLMWLELGGVYAVANLRGGSEYGEMWHQAGMLERKQNVFDDFIAAAEWLIDTGYTNSERLAIIGGSNGGLLVAACMLQRPELFGAVICQVPVIDMLRYHKFTIGRYWTGEYGNAEENPDHFQILYAYSPLHNIEAGTTYPPTLIATADTDDRVVPAHARKFAATLQAADSGYHPILLRVEMQAGHGLGKPTTKLIDELSDIYAFLVQVFDISR